MREAGGYKGGIWLLAQSENSSPSGDGCDLIYPGFNPRLACYLSSFILGMLAF